MVENRYDKADLHGPDELVDLGDLVLEAGPTLRGCEPAQQILGISDAAKDDAVLVTSWYPGQAWTWRPGDFSRHTGRTSKQRWHATWPDRTCSPTRFAPFPPPPQGVPCPSSR